MRKRTAIIAAIIAVCGVAASPITRGGAAISFQKYEPHVVSMKDVPADFSLPDAMKELYGNYDPARKSSIFKLTKTFKGSFFDKPGKVEVQAFLAGGVADSGATKVFLLTFAVPARSPMFQCHACAPVIGAAVFAKKSGAWSVECENKALSVLGNFGGPPNAEIIRIGPDRGAFELDPGNTFQGETTAETLILLPWKGELSEAFSAKTDWPEDTDCGDGMGGCRDMSAKISFERGANTDYDDIVVKISATETDAHDKEVQVHREQHWKFANGKYARAKG